MNFEECFCQKSAGSAGWVKFVTAALGNAQIMENIGENVRHFHENKQTRHKERGEGLISKIPELMHNVLSNEKDAIEVRHNQHFCYIPRLL